MVSWKPHLLDPWNVELVCALYRGLDDRRPELDPSLIQRKCMSEVLAGWILIRARENTGENAR
jgi:hypothetical protein